jgi:hypothetical protein
LVNSLAFGGRCLLTARVHEIRERALYAVHPHLLAAKQNLAATRNDLADLEGAFALRLRRQPETTPFQASLRLSNPGATHQRRLRMSRSPGDSPAPADFLKA